MPIVSRNKRASCIGIDFNWFHVFPNPDGSISVNDRQQIGMKYAGTLTSSTATGGQVSTYRCLMGVGI